MGTHQPQVKTMSVSFGSPSSTWVLGDRLLAAATQGQPRDTISTRPTEPVTALSVREVLVRSRKTAGLPRSNTFPRNRFALRDPQRPTKHFSPTVVSALATPEGLAALSQKVRSLPKRQRTCAFPHRDANRSERGNASTSWRRGCQPSGFKPQKSASLSASPRHERALGRGAALFNPDANIGPYSGNPSTNKASSWGSSWRTG